MAKINGSIDSQADGLTLAQYLEQTGFDRSRIACELNGEIIAQEHYDARLLTAVDVLEIVRFVGGG